MLTHFLLSRSKKSFPLNGHLGFKRDGFQVISAPSDVTGASDQEEGSGIEMPSKEASVWPFFWGGVTLSYFFKPLPCAPATLLSDELLHDDEDSPSSRPRAPACEE